MAELGIAVEKVCALIAHVRAIDVQVDVVEPDVGSNPSDEDMREVLEAYADDPSFEEAHEVVAGLNEDEQINLVALAWLGRGTFDDWDEALDEARDAHNERTAEYLLGMPLLGDYLEEGLATLGYSCEDWDRE